MDMYFWTMMKAGGRAGAGGGTEKGLGVGRKYAKLY